jgi:hypothetical protein
MTGPGDARDKQLGALDALGQIEVDAPDKRVAAPTPEQLLALAAEVENSDEHERLHTDLLEDVGSVLRDAAHALAAMALERDVAHANLAEARLAWLAGANWAHPGVLIEIGDNPYGIEATA